jgi:hypothetical protein
MARDAPLDGVPRYRQRVETIPFLGHPVWVLRQSDAARGARGAVRTRLLPRGSVPAPRQGDKTAIVAVAHSILVIAYHTGEGAG